jgi:hypothetical protein
MADTNKEFIDIEEKRFFPSILKWISKESVYNGNKTIKIKFQFLNQSPVLFSLLVTPQVSTPLHQ